MKSINKATSEADFSGIKEIWQDKFPTDNNYYNIVFGKILPHCTNYIYSQDGKVISVISLMPMKFINEEIPLCLNGWYLFGVATRSGFEGKGIASGLIKEAITDLKSKGYSFIFERPANQALNNFYLKLGFTISVKRQRYLFPPDFFDNRETSHQEKTLISHIQKHFKARFEWVNKDILKGLIELGEIERHNELQTEELLKEDTYIAINPFKQEHINMFKNVFFCFSLE